MSSVFGLTIFLLTPFPSFLPFHHIFINPLTHVFSLQCLYCEGTFRDHTTLKEHMRKKLHKRINPKNKTYDKFYVINYLEFGKSWEEVQSEDDREIINQDDK